MSPREKKLLTLFAIAGFVMVNLLGLSLYKRKSADMEVRLSKARSDLQLIQMSEGNRQQRVQEMDWLEQHLPEPAEYENVQTALQAYCVAEAKRFGLSYVEVPSRNKEELKGGHFQRIQIVYRVSGTEENLYRWLDRINMPTQFRACTKLVLSPNKEDDTKIDCTATIEQWFVPAEPAI